MVLEENPHCGFSSVASSFTAESIAGTNRVCEATQSFSSEW